MMRRALVVIACLAFAACSSAPKYSYTQDYQEPYSGKKVFKGMASWYGPGFHGKPTASGEPYDQHAMTAAHKTLPMGTKLKVTNLKNRRSVVVTVNDRGPFVKKRIIDLSYAAAKKLKMIGPGTAKVKVEVLGRDAKYVRYIKYDELKGPFTVQVASFSDRLAAIRFMRKLQVDYDRAYLFETKIKDRRYYRVRIGKFGSRGDAESYAGRMASDGYSPMVLLYEEQI